MKKGADLGRKLSIYVSSALMRLLLLAGAREQGDGLRLQPKNRLLSVSMRAGVGRDGLFISAHPSRVLVHLALRFTPRIAFLLIL